MDGRFEGFWLQTTAGAAGISIGGGPGSVSGQLFPAVI